MNSFRRALCFDTAHHQSVIPEVAQRISGISFLPTGYWSFICICLNELVKLDPSLNEIYYLNYGEWAERSTAGSEWKVYAAE